jgi:predicted membrane chloride channel (bestrophin family)
MTHDRETRNEILRLILLTNAIVFQNLQNESPNSKTLQEKDGSGIITLSAREMKVLDQTNGGDREAVCFSWLHSVVNSAAEANLFHVAAPILSRSYQVLSETRLALSQCKKIQTTPFPFAYAQLCFVILHIFMVVVPIVCAQYLGGVVLPALVSLAAVCKSITLELLCATS